MSSMLKLLLPLTREKRGGLQRSLLRPSQSSRQAMAQCLNGLTTVPINISDAELTCACHLSVGSNV